MADLNYSFLIFCPTIREDNNQKYDHRKIKSAQSPTTYFGVATTRWPYYTIRNHVVELAISIDDDKEAGAYLLDLDELNPPRYKIIAGSIASLFEHEIKIERDSHVRTAAIRDKGLWSVLAILPVSRSSWNEYIESLRVHRFTKGTSIH